jgi:hypothetical protein
MRDNFLCPWAAETTPKRGPANPGKLMAADVIPICHPGTNDSK